MTTRDSIEKKLSEYQARHTGKDPFGPLTDLKKIYESLSIHNRHLFIEVLEEKKSDKFWGDFIRLFIQSNEI